MRPYEIVIIFDAGLDESTVRQVVDRAVDSLRANGGNPGQVDYWGKRRLAYQIGGRWEGNYVIIEVIAPPAAVSETSRTLSLADEVIRHKVVRLPEAAAGRVRLASVSDGTVPTEQARPTDHEDVQGFPPSVVASATETN